MENETDFFKLLRDLEIPIKPEPERYPVANIADFLITTDSVVAIATVVTDNTMRRIVIDWGDGETDTLNYRPGRDIPTVFDEDDPLPPGTYKFRHAYEVSEDGRPFEYFVLLRVDDRDGGVDFRIIKVTLTPRYKVTNYRTTVRLLSRCDPIGESTSEFDIDQIVDGAIVNRWHWEPSNSFFGESQRFRLEGSGVARELTVADGFVDVRLVLTETDLFFDEHLVVNESISATQESERIERTVSSGGCKVLVRYDREVQLIVPLPSGGPVFA
jgi:hypothetical protein